MRASFLENLGQPCIATDGEPEDRLVARRQIVFNALAPLLGTLAGAMDNGHARRALAAPAALTPRVTSGPATTPPRGLL